MASADQPPTVQPAPPPRPPSSARKWFWRGCGCLTITLVLSCCCCGGIGWYLTSSYTEHGAMVERIHHEVLADGDVDAAWDNCSPAFKVMHTKEQLARFLQGYEKFRDGTRLPGAAPECLVVDGETYLILQVSVLASWAAGFDTITFVCHVEPDGKLTLVGIRCRRVEGGSLELAIPGPVLKAVDALERSGFDD